MQLTQGMQLEDLTLPNINGSQFDLQDVKGKKALISFFRYSSCPFCHLRIHEIIERQSDFGKPFEKIFIFNCKLRDLKVTSSMHDSSVTVLADENRTYFDRYEVPKSAVKTLVGAATGFSRFRKAVSTGFSPLTKPSGAFTGMPVDVLIDEAGIVERVLYGSSTFDHIPIEEVIEFSKT